MSPKLAVLKANSRISADSHTLQESSTYLGVVLKLFKNQIITEACAYAITLSVMAFVILMK